MLTSSTHEASELATWAARLGTRAVQRVLEENRRLGIPSAFEFRGRLVFEMPDGTLTTDDPFATPPGGDAPGA